MKGRTCVERVKAFARSSCDGTSSSISRRASEARKADRQSSRVRTRSLENRTQRFPERCKYDENSTTNRRKLVLGQFGTIKVHSAAARDTPERLRSAKKLLRIRSESPRAAPRRSRKRPGSVLEAPGTPEGQLWLQFGRVRGTVHCPNASRIGFSSFLFRRAKSPMCFAYHVLLCFVVLGRRKFRTGGKGAESRNSMVFGFQNRPRDRPGDPKSRPGGSVRAVHCESYAKNL